MVEVTMNREQAATNIGIIDDLLHELASVAPIWPTLSRLDQGSFEYEWHDGMDRLRLLATERLAGRLDAAHSDEVDRLVERALEARSSAQTIGLRVVDMTGWFAA